MLRGVLFLVLAAALFGVFWPLIRGRNRSSRPPAQPATAATHALPSASGQPGEQGWSSAEVFRKFNELAFGGVTLAASPPAKHSSVAVAARAALDSLATDPRYSPRRPLLLPQLMQAVNDSESSRHELTQIIVRDPALTGSLLKLANSTLYRIGPKPVENIERAVALLGIDGIRSVAAAAVVQPVFRVSGGAFARFPELIWEQTMQSGAAAEVHAAIVEDSDPFAAQLLGLVAGLGAIIVFRAVMDGYRERPELQPDPALVAALIEERTPDVSRRVAESWGLSERILEALEDQRAGKELAQMSSLGRSLRFGRLVGALTVLYANEQVDEITAKASMEGNGATGAQIKRIWKRMTKGPEERELRPARQG